MRINFLGLFVQTKEPHVLLYSLTKSSRNLTSSLFERRTDYTSPPGVSEWRKNISPDLPSLRGWGYNKRSPVDFYPATLGYLPFVGIEMIHHNTQPPPGVFADNLVHEGDKIRSLAGFVDPRG